MDALTRKALTASIAKWGSVVAGDGADEYQDNCALCQIFDAPDYYDRRCEGCPVSAAVNRVGCSGTPWIAWDDHMSHHRIVAQKRRMVQRGCADCARLAQAELDFLRSLLPAEASP